MKLGWIGTASFQAFTVGGQEVVFDLEEGNTPPPEFKEGDAVDVINRPDHPAMISMGLNYGYYIVTHVPSGVKMEVLHKTSGWRFEP
jgi:hypothetical protein